MNEIQTKSLFLELSIGALLRFFNLLGFHALQSDEAIYSQAAFAFSKGYIPYKDVFFAHPPVSLFLNGLALTINPSLVSLRVLNVFFGLATILLIFYLGRLLYSEKIGLIAGALYAFYPLAIFSNKLVLVENSQTFFALLAVILFVKFLTRNHAKYLILSGFIAGVSLMTKYTSILFIGALIIFGLFRFGRDKIKKTAYFVASVSIFPLVALAFLLTSGSWLYFYTQTVVWQGIRFGMPVYEKLFFFGQIVGSLLPLLFLAIPAIIVGGREWKKELIAMLFLLPLGSLVFSKVIFLQYSFLLLPPVSILAALAIDIFHQNVGAVTIIDRRKILKWISLLATLVSVACAIVIMTNASVGIRWLFFESYAGNSDQAALVNEQMLAGDYVRSITKTDDKIWTTDASIAFFAQRIIVSPCSEFWRFQGFFQDVWAYSWTVDDYRGPISGYPQGLITLNDIKCAWGRSSPKVIVIIRTSNVDYFIWNGINNAYHDEQGLGSYIKHHYFLGRTFDDNNIEIWIKP